MNISKMKRSTQIAIMAGAGSGAVEKTASGTSPLTLADSVAGNILSITVNGHSEVSAGSIVSVGDNGLTVQTTGKNLLNYDAWKSVHVSRGTAIFENNGITITASSYDCYTEWSPTEFPSNARIPVKQGEIITLSWDNTSKLDGGVFIFPDGLTTGGAHVNNVDVKNLRYIVPSGVSFITFRFGVSSAGTTISYKNIQIERSSMPTDFEPYRSTSAEFATALPLRSTLDGTTRDELIIGNGKAEVITRCEVVDDSIVPLANPTVTPLTDAEISAFRGLRTFDPTTSISITDNPSITVTYMGKKTTRTAPKKRTSRKKKV